MFKFERCEPDDPNRCQGVGKTGQCPFKAIPEARYCGRHGGGKQLQSQRADNARLYLLARWQDKFGRQVDHPNIKSLREEIAILRMTLDIRFETLKDDQEMMMRSGSIVELIREIAKTVQMCHRLEKEMNVVMDKTQAMAWVQELTTIIGTFIGDPDIMDAIGEEMLESLERRTNGSQVED